jgi:hypothetical protein
MALAKGVAGARHSAQQITWKKDDGAAYDLTGATITARIRDKVNGETRNADGTFALVTAASGIFSWSYGALDVARPGKFEVQFIASYGDGKSDKTYLADWDVEQGL